MIAYYITAHGYGHAARSLEVVEALLEHCPVTVVTQVSEPFLRERLGSRLQLRRRALDVGVVQVDSLHGDASQTLARVQELMARSPALLNEEVEFYRAKGVRLVVVDAPALPLEAAYQYGIPGLAVASFGWDYIYSLFAERDPAWREVCQWFRRGYAQATHYLRYPFSEAMPEITSREDIPLVARPGSSRRDFLGADPEKPWVLLGFHQLNLDASARQRLQSLPYEFFNLPSTEVGPPGPNMHCPALGSNDFRDLVASMDVVLSKPGFGIVSDCLANAKPLVYVPRDDFRESRLLEEGIRRYLRHACIPAAELYVGNLQPFIEQARRASAPSESLPCAGAQAIADRILSFL